jgi:hypothetical protein
MQPNALLLRQNFIIHKKWVLHHLRQGQPEHGRDGCAPGHFACTLDRWGGQGVLATKEHPQHRCSAVGGELITAPNQGLYIDPQPFQGQRTKGHLGSSRGRNDFLTGVDISLQSVGLSKRAVRTPDMSSKPLGG